MLLLREAPRGHGTEKFPHAGLLASSVARNWHGILVEQRAHPLGEIPSFTAAQTEITMIMATVEGARVRRRGNGEVQDSSAQPGTLWLSPRGIFEDCIRISNHLPSVLHMYVTDELFAAIAAENSLAWSSSQCIRYEAGFTDPLIEQIGRSLFAELLCNSMGGDVLAESLACTLAIRLMCNHMEGARSVVRGLARLDARRLRQVQDFIECNLESDLRLQDIAAVIGLSQFHFLRAFKGATGMAPHRYITARRIALARRLLGNPSLPLVEVALACRFSSQASFARAFRRETGVTPGRFRMAIA